MTRQRRTPPPLGRVLDQHIQHGVQYLYSRAGDVRQLKDWPARIDVLTLDMRSPKRDVLGQIFGRYDIGCAKLGLLPRECAALGFVIAPSMAGPYGYDRAVKTLTDRWAERVWSLQGALV